MRTPCIDIESWRLQEALRKARGEGAPPPEEESAALVPVDEAGEVEISEDAVRQSDRAIAIMVAERRKHNLINRAVYEKKAWSLAMRLINYLDNRTDEELDEMFGGQTAPRQIQAIERLTRSMNTILKNLELEREGVPEEADMFSLMSDEELDAALERLEGRGAGG